MTPKWSRPDSPSRQAAERHGRRAELVASLFLRLKGYRILARRFRTPVGEIDLIARRSRTIAFIEVKARATGDAGLEAVAARTRKRIARAAGFWLAAHPRAEGSTLRFDVIVVLPRRLPLHLRGAFDSAGRP